MRLRDFSHSPRGNQSFFPLFEVYYTAARQHWFLSPFCIIISGWLSGTKVSRWEISLCVYACTLSQIHRPPFCFLSGTSVARFVPLSFSPLFSFAYPPAHESLSNRLYFSIFIFHSVSRYRSRSSRSSLCRFNLLLTMLAESRSAPIYIQTMDGVESWFTSSFLLSLTLLEPLIPCSHPLFLSLPTAPSPYCAFRIVGVFGNE